MKKEIEQKISQLQLMESNLQSALLQKRTLQIQLLEVENVLTESKLEILYALNLYKYSPGLNFTDCVIITQMQSFNIDEFLTFDEKLRKLYDSFTKN